MCHIQAETEAEKEEDKEDKEEEEEDCAPCDKCESEDKECDMCKKRCDEGKCENYLLRIGHKWGHFAHFG